MILDEASMASEVEALVPMVSTRADQIVLVGDHRQLQPVILSHEAQDLGLDSTFFNKYWEQAVMLTKQYRMVCSSNSSKNSCKNEYVFV